MPLNFLGLEKLKALFSTIKFYGGIKNFLLATSRYDDAKIGKFVGKDKFGNMYFENDFFFIGKNRWVIFANRVGYDYDASQVTPEWYGWLHYKTDFLPHEDPTRPNYKWMAEHTENMTGTPKQYVPYSTTKRKIEPWVPPTCKK